jgi:hypothetical protein
VIAAAGGATISGIAGSGLAIFGGARRIRRSLALGKFSRFKIKIIECLRDCSRY